VPNFSTDIAQLCKRCSHPLTPGALACDGCQTLVHAGELDRLAAQARNLEARSDLQQAHQVWQSALPLLPFGSRQAEWIREHLRELESAISNADHQRHAGQAKQWAKRIAPLGPLAALLAKGKTLLFFLVKLKFLVSFAEYIGLYWSMWGAKFGIGFALLILVHEMGHFIDIKRRGLPAEMPVFLPGLGAFVRWQAMGVSLETRAAVSLAGPLAGFFSAVACWVIATQTGDPIWFALARTAAWLNLLNLIPIWVLDGAGAMLPLSMPEKLLVMLTAAGLAYATGQGIFWFIGGGALVNMVLVALESRQPRPIALVQLNLEGREGSTQTISMDHEAHSLDAPHDDTRRGSPLIAAYYVGLLAALGAVLYWLPGNGNAVP
jgi:Zn-dependent protease